MARQGIGTQAIMDLDIPTKIKLAFAAEEYTNRNAKEFLDVADIEDYDSCRGPAPVRRALEVRRDTYATLLFHMRRKILGDKWY